MVSHYDSWLEWMGGCWRANLVGFLSCSVALGEGVTLEILHNPISPDLNQPLDAGPTLHHHYLCDLLGEKLETSFEVLLQEMNMDWVYPGACIEMETQMDLQVQGSQMYWDLGSWLEFSLEWRA